MNYTEETANELADLALAEAEASGSPKIVDQIGELLGASSQSLQEAYLTAVRVRRAEARARELLAEAAIKRGAQPPAKRAPKPAPVIEVAQTVEEPPEPAVEETPVEDAPKPKRKGW
ncbi:hypothetical protein SAMN04488515_0913 [Cognatiyoonia koreensis]|uniref:Uncharacterized protein n=1 Tax=Cognatiyoonia koreensis TaxID=364200 RepID=A0A1I0NZU8_9RHOB|nr:hypothetical protein [Cognatiyoonia koreensis]SEW07155.1 hypothetical protein SAMN04488515_0913 [Cognatiyoonia koreensis]